MFISISVGGLFAFESLWAVAFVFLGCWAMMAIRQTPNRRAERIITRLGGKFPAIDYTFDEENFTANFGANADLVPYGEVVRLIEDKTYCYFFLKSFSVYMFAQKSAENPEELKEYLATQTGLRWRAGKDLFSVSLKDILDAVMTRI
ncbi:MAG: hypothetical protein LBT65_05760 [Synergistaceae bacterium]|nr:hypothetical protein [Synergistaceae bacterium]